MEPNSLLPTPAAGGESQLTAEAAQHEKSIRLRIGMFGFFLFLVSQIYIFGVR